MNHQGTKNTKVHEDLCEDFSGSLFVRPEANVLKIPKNKSLRFFAARPFVLLLLFFRDSSEREMNNDPEKFGVLRVFVVYPLQVVKNFVSLR